MTIKGQKMTVKGQKANNMKTQIEKCDIIILCNQRNKWSTVCIELQL